MSPPYTEINKDDTWRDKGRWRVDGAEAPGNKARAAEGEEVTEVKRAERPGKGAANGGKNLFEKIFNNNSP